jgi:two-component system LytT family sensor kinase
VVENAIQHAVAPRATPGRINIGAQRFGALLRLEVKDNGPGIKPSGDSVVRQGLGLSNVDARLRRIYGEEFSFEMTNAPEGGLTVVIEMPWAISDDSIAGRKRDEDRKD